MEKQTREQLEKIVKEHIHELTDEQLQFVTDYVETAIYENNYEEELMDI